MFAAGITKVIERLWWLLLLIDGHGTNKKRAEINLHLKQSL
jgi:hypothetical protein